MEENLFIQAMNPQEVADINETKLNKEFALRLIYDLSKVFQTNHQVFNERDSVEIRMKTSPNHNWYGCFRFTADKKGISFYANILTYHKHIGHLYVKYKENEGTKKERENDDHCNFKIEIKINRHDSNINEKLKDIVELMNLNRFNKRF